MEQNNHSAELLNLRKETAKLKDELKKTKEEIRLKDKSLKEQESNVKNKIFALKEENSRFVTQLKEMDLSLKQCNESLKKQVPLSDFEQKLVELSQIKDDLSHAKQKISEYEKSKKQNIAKLTSLQDKLKSTEQDLQKWVDSAKSIDGKPLDVSAFLRWHDRAITGRKMYRLMRQMRELSDSKISTYQDGIVTLSKWVLEQKNIGFPSIPPSEVPADRLLAEAWNAILSSSPQAKNDRADSHSEQALM